MNRSVLIVTPNFPPEHQVGVLRAYRLAKYLPALGWKVHVLTTDVNYFHPEDHSLLESLPESVEIHRARYIEPTVRGVRMALGGKSRSYAALQQHGVATPARSAADGQSRPGGASLTRRAPTAAIHALGERWLLNPDHYATWHRPALRMARRIVRDHDIPLVFTTEPDFTGPLIGADLQREGMWWVADLRDPSVYLMKPTDDRRSQRRYARAREIERRSATAADAVTVASQSIGMILGDMYGHEALRPVSFIPTGIDEDLLQRASKDHVPSWPYILYPGRLSKEYGAGFVELFARALDDQAALGTGVRFLVVGETRHNAPLLLPHVNRLQLQHRVELWDYLPQQEILGLLDGALAGVLMTGRDARWWCLHAKLVEYLAMRKPVVAMLPALSESRIHLQNAGLGVFLDGDRDAAATVLRRFLLAKGPCTEPNDEVCDRFTAPRMAEAFAAVFERVLEGRS